MKTKLMNDLKEAMKSKDKVKKNTIQMIRSEILRYEKDNKTEADDNKIIEILFKEKKKRSEALDEFRKANRLDLIEETRNELDIIQNYLPEQMSDEELKLEIAKIINDNDLWLKSEMGTAMRACKEAIGNKADGKRISDYVKEYLAFREEELNKRNGK